MKRGGAIARTRVLGRARELDAVASPVRARIVQCLDLYGPSSVAALASHTGRKPPSLYYHMQLLVDAGLVKAVGAGPSTRRPSTVYALAARRFVSKPGATTPAYRRAFVRAAGAFLRLAHREFGASLGADEASRGRVRRHELWLGARERARLNRLLAELDRFAASCARRKRGEPAALTLVLAPVQRHG